MKNYVSLLPLEYKEQLLQSRELKQKSKYINVFIAFFLVLTAISSGKYFYNTMRLADLEEQYTQVNDKIIQMSKFEVIRKEMVEIKEKIVAVTETDLMWLTYIAQMSEALPNGVWVESLDSSINADGQSVLTLKCGSNVYGDISKTIRGMYTQPDIINAYCVSSTETSGLVSFILELTKAPKKE